LDAEAAAMTELTRYDTACRAIAEAATVDEMKFIRDEHAAMAAYARQAKNRELEARCAEIRMRATRRLGEMIREQKRTVGLAKGAANAGYRKTRVDTSGGLSNNPSENIPTLASQGIDKNLAHQARTLSDLPPEKFEGRVAQARDAALGVVDKVVRAQARETMKHDREQPYGKPTDHANAPYELRQKARQQRSKAAALSRMAPNTVEGWRRGYINACRIGAPNLDAELQLVVDAFQEIIGEREKPRRVAE
jgi:hypothetical protein